MEKEASTVPSPPCPPSRWGLIVLGVILSLLLVRVYSLCDPTYVKTQERFMKMDDLYTDGLLFDNRRNP